MRREQSAADSVEAVPRWVLRGVQWWQAKFPLGR